MTFENSLAVFLVCLAGWVVAKQVRSARREAKEIEETVARCEREIQEMQRKRLMETEESIALQLASLADDKSYLLVDVDQAEDAPSGHIVTIRTKEGERQLLRVYIDLTHFHGEWPIALELGENAPTLYRHSDKDTLERVAEAAMQYIEAALHPGRIH